MRAMFVACFLGLLVSAVASPAHARAFCQFKDCQKTSVQKAAGRHTATRVHKFVPQADCPSSEPHGNAHRVCPCARQTATHTASVHAPRHMATATPKHLLMHSATRSVHATKTVSRPHPVRSASREYASWEPSDGVVSGGSQLIRLAMDHVGDIRLAGATTGVAGSWR